jgi:hypothetical protein
LNAKLATLLVSAALGSAGAVGVSIAAGWGLVAAVMMYGVGGSLSLLAASVLVYAAEEAAPEKPAHA